MPVCGHSLIDGDVNGSQYHPPSASNGSGVSVLVGSILLTSPTWWGGGSVSAKRFKDIAMCGP